MSFDPHRKVHLSDCAAFQEGYVNPSQHDPSYFGSDVKWLRATDLNDGFVLETSRKLSTKGFESAGKSATLFAPGTLAISKSGTIGRIGILKDYMCGNRAVINIKPHDSCDTRFIFYTLLFNRKKIELLAEGSVQKNLYVSALGRLQIRLPSLCEQRNIGAVLGALDNRIAHLRETNATLEAIAQRMFKSWFVDFDPVRAKQDGRVPDGLDEETAALFPSSFDESSLGFVPSGWRVGSVSSFAKQKKGSVSPLDSPETLFEHYSLPAFDSEQAPVMEAGSEIKSNKTPLPLEPVLLSKLNPHIPRVWLPGKPGNNAVCSTEFLAFGPCDGGSKEFIYCFFSSPSFLQRLCQVVTGTSNSHQRVKPDQVSTFPCVVPPLAILEGFTAAVRPIFARVNQNRAHAQTLAAVRDALLPRLISGQLRVPSVIEERLELLTGT